MPGLHIHRSNHLERLAGGLAEVLRTPLSSVLQPEIIVVQSVGMRRWLSLELANRLGIAMNVKFPFPATFAHDIFRSAFPQVARSNAFDKDRMTWSTVKLLPEILDAEDSELLSRYLREDPSGLKRFQLAQQIANVFDRYLLHRTEKLIEWQQTEKPASWQALLWKRLIEGEEETNPPALLQRFCSRVDGGRTELARIPGRLSVFGVSSLSPFYVHLIGAVARCIDVHLYLFEPTDQYWGDIQSRREQDRMLRKHAATFSAEDLHLDSGNALLASMGKPARIFARTVQSLDPSTFKEPFEAPSRRTLLNAVQADVFELLDRSTDGTEKALLASNDRSIQVHCCHGPMREVEVLHDHLLDLLERVPGLSPKDILVMMPDVETYAPFIDAVFGAPESEVVRIPFSIADRPMQNEIAIAHSLLSILDLHGSRFGVATILALLECEPLRAKFGIEETDTPDIREWVEAAGIRWGYDGAHRAEFDIPPFEQNSWRQGLDRLLLGYALPGDGTQIFDGLLPVPDVEGSRAIALGNFVNFAETLFATVRSLARPRSLSEWSVTLSDSLTTLFAESDSTVGEFYRLRAVFVALGDLSTAYNEAISFQVMRAQLSQLMLDADSGVGYLAGYTTFCSLRPMRSVPFKVICVLGMDATAFPRSDSPLTFDLTSQETRPGDRNRRDDDRQLFLETLLSARETLYLSYSGLSQRDSSESPPSVVISELLDYLDSNYALPDNRPVRSAILTKHRLQAFSDAYFQGDDRLFSYSFENCRAGAARNDRVAERPHFFDRPLALPEDLDRTLSLDRLITYFRNPARSFLRDRLRLRLPENSSPLEEREPVQLNALERTILCGDYLDLSLEGADSAEILAIQRAGSRLPVGWSGDAEFRAIEGTATTLLRSLGPLIKDPPLKPLEVDLTVGEWRITGQLSNIYPSGAIHYRGAAIKPADLIKAWISHIMLCAARSEGYPGTTYLYGTKDAEVDKICFGAIENPLAALGDLVEIYSNGIVQPIPFFPKTSWAYARKLSEDDTEEGRAKAFKAAQNEWESRSGKDGRRGENEDEAIQISFRGIADPLDEEWRNLARRVFAPMIAAMNGEAGS